MPGGAPSFNWTEKAEDKIFNSIMDGDSIVDICGPDRDDFMPGARTVYKRLASDEAFAQRYARAREVQAHREADEIRDIADRATPESVHVARLQIDARKWRAGKLAPKKYGDKIDVVSTDGSMTPKPNIIEFVAPKSNAQSDD